MINGKLNEGTLLGGEGGNDAHWKENDKIVCCLTWPNSDNRTVFSSFLSTVYEERARKKEQIS